MSKTKSYEISKMSVWRAYERVKANKGSFGVDNQSIEDFEQNLKKNLYKIWNRMSSGTYFPPAVRTVAIPKKDGSKRYLGIPTVSDRIAQMVVKMHLEPVVDPVFHEDSYGYRPGKSAHQAVEVCKQRCWKLDWVVDLDIKGFFDNIDHFLLMRAVRKHTDCKWILLYIERWLKAPIQKEDGSVVGREKGTPQGGVVSPLLANIFMHHAFDVWFTKRFPNVKFERYADDVIVHCRTRKEAWFVKCTIAERLQQCKLELHPEKTKLVYCEDTLREQTIQLHNKNFPQTSFDFLGFTFRRRTAKGNRGELYDGFLPAMSDKARKEIQRTIRSWGIGRKTDKSLQDLSRMFNPILRGWFNYYGRFYPKALKPINHQMNFVLTKWAWRKFKRFHKHRGPAGKWVQGIAKSSPGLFANWKMFHEIKTTG